MSKVQIYLKPRPVSPIYGHSNYLPFQWNPDFKYGPFFADYGPIPPDATEVYIIHSPYLSAGIATFHNELIPSLADAEAEVPDPDQTCRSLWPSLYELQRAKLGPVSQFLRDSESHVNMLYQGDHARFPPPPGVSKDPEWHKLFFSILASRRDVELHDSDVDTELEIFAWAYMHYMVFYISLPWIKLRTEMADRKDAYATNTPFSAKGSMSLDEFRAEALLFPSKYVPQGNHPDNERPNADVLMHSVLRRRNPSTVPDDADLV
ncbi:uncharacterized protein EV420DRAFT_1764587 [Desarmillaria tabescens]|uniref:Uncharacterized protein n=1 Tax=Armillaria tabescens TaxID=1929756 RepID=A0AA39KBJ1_ARMTA|nr:uncharacterized protein EV420DRAFT_1764587 [Desarmillaria tabescens]KAK0458121.1 hypothetical protein EV420DRAFT_1764587 [Desarmillaria tabescens]